MNQGYAECRISIKAVLLGHFFGVAGIGACSKDAAFGGGRPKDGIDGFQIEFFRLVAHVMNIYSCMR